MSDKVQASGTNFVIRKMLMTDAVAVHRLLKEAPEAANWTEDSIRASLGSNHTLAFVSARDQEISGCIFGTKIANEAEILNLAVKLPSRRKGIAGALVRHILTEWQDQNLQRIFLEVRESNLGAIKFYEGLSFRQAGRRKKYYAEPEEDALVLERHSTSNNPQIGTR